MKRLVAVAIAAVLALAAIPATASAACPPGRSTMGCSLPTPLKGVSAPPRGEIVPDVSSYQQTVNWTAVKAWQLAHHWRIPGGIFKLGENSIDPYAIQNARALRALHMAVIGYVFVRPGITASTVIGWARAAGVKVLVLDEEVPGINGTAASLVPRLRTAGLTVVDYHSQGNVYDSTAKGLPCWDADYGPRTPPVCTTGATTAWQFTDIGSIPGINGLVDESVSYGLLKLAAPPIKTICFGKGATPRSTKCKPIISHYDWLIERHQFWRWEYGQCVRYPEGIRCGSALHWARLREFQAVKLRARYSA